MLREILWLDSGDTIIIRGTGKQTQYNCVTPNRTLFLDNVFQLFYACVDLLHHHGEFDSLVLELQQLFSVSQWKTAIFVLAAA